MPYKNKEDYKKYYERHQKHYHKQFINGHREEWNSYQKNYRISKRKEAAEAIKKELLELKIGNPNELSFKAAVILVYAIKNEATRLWAIARRIGYDFKEVKLIFKNWEDNGVYQNGQFDIDFSGSDLENIVELTLLSLVGSGEIGREETEI